MITRLIRLAIYVLVNRFMRKLKVWGEDCITIVPYETRSRISRQSST